jgi:hypothetical protein
MKTTDRRSAQARAEARSLVEMLRRSNRRIEERGGAALPEEEYGRLEQELTRRLLKRAA